MITAERLRELLIYDPKTGVFTWRVRRSNVAAGTVAGKSLPTGYILIRIDGRTYYAHRLAFLYQIGRWPREQTDHIDRVTNHNAWANLREATQTQNNANRGSSKRKGFGLKGAHRRGSRWHARITSGDRVLHLGTFASELAAHEAYMSKARELHGEFARAA